METAVDVDRIFLRLMGSKFRAKQKLRSDEIEYLGKKGITEVLEHARQFIIERLADAEPVNDGKQTPMHGHPAFVAQHATATCCRGCLMKWHGIAAGRELTESEVDYIVDVIDRWLCLHNEAAGSGLRVVGDEIDETSSESPESEEVAQPVVARLTPENKPPKIAAEVQMEEAVILNIGAARPSEPLGESDEPQGDEPQGDEPPDDEMEPLGAGSELEDSGPIEIEVVFDDTPLSDEVERLIEDKVKASKKKPKKKKKAEKESESSDGWVQGTLF